MMQPKLPAGWDELTKEQLLEVHRLIGEFKDNRTIRNFKVYLYLTGLQLHEGDVEIGKDGVSEYYLKAPGGAGGEEQYFTVKADDLQLYLDGIHLEDGPKQAKKLEMAGALDWLDLPVGKDGSGGLMQLPEEYTTIGGKVFQLPTSLVTNLTYEQYSNVQKLQQAVWGLMEQAQEHQKKVLELDVRIQKMLQKVEDRNDIPERTQNTIKRLQGDITAEVQEIEQVVKEMNHYKAQMLCHILTPRRRRISWDTVMENLGNLRLWKWKGIIEYYYEYTSDRAEAMLSWMEKQEDMNWLFDILVQHMQSCLGLYKTQFPELFSKDGGGGREVIPLVSEVDTINAIMKWQQYIKQQDVYDSNAVQIFSILNSMTKEAKSIEEMNAKMKAGSKRR